MTTHATDALRQATVLTAEALLLRLFPGSTRFTPAEVEALTLRAGLWALTHEAQTHERELPRLLKQQLGALRQPHAPAVPDPPPAHPLADAETHRVRQRAEALGQPWPLKQPVRFQVTQTSYRVYPALLAAVQDVRPRGDRTSDYDLQITLALAYLALPGLHQRVNALLRLRYTQDLADPAARRHPDGAPVAAVLTACDLPWRGHVTLRGRTKQIAMRVTTALAAALKAAPPADLRPTVADLHTTLLALYVADPALRAQIHQLLQARRSAIAL